MKTFAISLLLMTSIYTAAQEKPYYFEIPEAPDNYTAASVAARLVDGLGFRYYWATEGLNALDLTFRPSEEARTLMETLEHIEGLTKVLLNAIQQLPNTSSDKSGKEDKMSFTDLRQQTLEQIKSASEFLKQPDANLEDFDMTFESDKGKKKYPFWNLINGPISDAIWHVGQVVSFRRSAGNPLPKGVSVLEGVKKE